MADDALARALAENRRRSEVMASSQRFGPPTTTAPASDCTRVDHLWATMNEGDGPFLICERCAATVPYPEALLVVIAGLWLVEPGVQLVELRHVTEPAEG